MAVPHVIHDSRDTTITEQQKQTETLRSEMQKSQSHLVQIMSTTIATKALEDVRDDLLLSLKGAMEECMQAQRLDVGPQVQFLVGKCLQHDLPIHSAKLAEQRGNNVSVSLSSSSPCHVTPISHHAPSQPDKIQRRKKGSLISSTSYKYKFLGIGVSITLSSHSNHQNQFSGPSLGACDISSTSVSIFLRIPWARRGLDLRYEMPSVPYSRESFISLRPYYIHAKGSKFHKAATEFDIETVRNLFEQGMASPLDEIEGLRDLLGLMDRLSEGDDNNDSHLEWVKFILRHSVNRHIHVHNPHILSYLSMFEGIEILDKAFPLLLEYSQNDFLQNPDIRFSLLHMDHPSPEQSR